MLRATCKNLAIAHGLNRYLVDKYMDHVGQWKTASEKHYNHHQYEKELRQLVNTWADVLDGVLKPTMKVVGGE